MLMTLDLGTRIKPEDLVKFQVLIWLQVQYKDSILKFLEYPLSGVRKLLLQSDIRQTVMGKGGFILGVRGLIISGVV
jgi:hypothetical protein